MVPVDYFFKGSMKKEWGQPSQPAFKLLDFNCAVNLYQIKKSIKGTNNQDLNGVQIAGLLINQKK